MNVKPDDLRTAAHHCVDTFTCVADELWTARAGELDRSCRETLDHIVSTQTFYATQLATEARTGLPRLRKHDLTASVADTLTLVVSGAAVLAAVARASAPGVRAFHPAGMADAEGFVAMGCDEILVHMGDIADGLGIAVAPPVDLCARVGARLFPWAPTDTDPWATLLWANGRAALGDRERLDADWYWHCAPLSEWDGTITRRTRPPSWTP
ncbi:MAG: hypothetical protein ACRDY4_04725 [Acidimicrobiia bacterium]